jgi:hypothetical protein
MEEELYKIYLKSNTVVNEGSLSTKKSNNLFDEFISECQKTFDKPAHTMLELRNRHNKKIKGDKFEVFCVYYLYDIYGLDNVWRLEDVPEEVLTKLGMKRRDMGIDIIGEKGNKYFAIQCKYKKYSEKKTVLTWKELSTFYALCLKTGPWEKYIVMTNCDYTRQAVRTEKDLIICKKQFQNISKEQWLKMCNVEGKKLNEPILEIPKENIYENEYLNKEDIKEEFMGTTIKKENPKSQEELRKLRLAYYEKKLNII